MEKFFIAFVRNPDRTWFCRAPINFTGENGPFTTTPGATYRQGQAINGYDIATWLDNWDKDKREPIGIAFFL